MKEFKDKALLGDCLETMKKIPDNTFDFSVQDPPYAIAFMGKKWDYDLPSVEVFAELLRVLKPGAHALIFGGTTTYHRLLVNVEDAGFQVRNTIPWLYGEGFPKNMDVSKQIDKMQGAEREVIGQSNRHGGGSSEIFEERGSNPITAPATDDAKKWDGFGTALKPATELIALVRKPISEKTIAANVLRWGTGALNIDGSRIGKDKITIKGYDGDSFQTAENKVKYKGKEKHVEGRWPANVIFDESTAQELDRQSGHSRSTPGGESGKTAIWSSVKEKIDRGGHNDKGGASRFFKVIDPSDGLFTYQSKASKSEKNAGCDNLELKTTTDGRKKDIDNAYLRGTTKRNNFHATVKPLGLIKYLANLISFPGAWGIDPYAGSGTFAIACRELFLHWTCIERDSDYYKIIEARLRQGYLIDTLIDQ